MPHHAVIKDSSNTTKVRVVFDASARSSSDVSLNETLLVGPTIQDKLFAHLVRFRAYKYVVTGDVEKMYRQVLLHEDDRKYQQILWRKDDDIETYRLNTLTFGVSSSPFLAIRTLHKLADDERQAFPRAAEILESHLYVDNLLSGAETINEARAIRTDMTSLLRRGGFSIRQWASNDKHIIAGLPDSELHANLLVNIDRSLKTLGIFWNTQTDEMCYSTHPTKTGDKVTKRSILSEIARIYDPLGLLGPVVLHAKKIMQDVWRSGVAWDESVPQTVYTDWSEFARQLELVHQIAFDRRVLSDQYVGIEIHGFCDASITGYVACLYVRSIGKDGDHRSKLLCAKSRVAPLKTVTIPRLELYGALLLARLYREAVPELKRATCLATNIPTADVFERVSSYSKLRRVVAYCLRFRPKGNRVGPLSAEEVQTAEIRILKIMQAAQFAREIQDLRDELSAPKGKAANLNPFLDDHGLLRVGGRLQKSELTFPQKHPILLPSRHRLTDQIIRETHEMHHHAGIQTTLYILRQRFWLLDGRNQVRKIVRTCTRCFRFRASAMVYKMGNLPSARVRETTPFENTGVDFCGPFFIKEKKHRNRTRVKVYVCIFVCMAVQAVHLEIVSDLTSDGFLAALRRFAARRGFPSHIFSENGTNFIGANNKLRELYAVLHSEAHKDRVQRYASEHNITWHFIPPAAPHFGGLWESMVKLFKHHFRRVVTDSLFTFEELNTLAIEIEGILNSRPITSMSSDPNDVMALTPAHFLIGKPLATLPEGNLLLLPANRLSTWQHITKVRQDFWARWSKEYLNELQQRHRWNKDGPNLELGTLVLLRDKQQPCSQWALGKVTSLHPGEDGVVRAATVKTASGELKRTTQVLCPLPRG